MSEANPRETKFGPRYREARETEGSKNRDSTVLIFCLVTAAVVADYDDMLFFSFCFCLLLLLLLLFVCVFGCLFVCLYVPFFPFAKLVLFGFLSWFRISLTCSIYIHVIFFSVH